VASNWDDQRERGRAAQGHGQVGRRDQRTVLLVVGALAGLGLLVVLAAVALALYLT
jgi:hypothetical protein